MGNFGECQSINIKYFEKEVLRKRPYIQREWCIKIIENPTKMEKQENNRYRFWGYVEQLDNRALPVITLDDKITIHNAFLDRRFKK